VAAEYLMLPQQELVKLPAHLNDVEAAALPCAGVTAWSAVTRNLSLHPGDRVLIQGTGGVSLFALQFALAAGTETYLISSSDEKLERAKALGAHHTLNYSATPEWGAAILEMTGSRGIDLIVDVVGPGSIEQSMAAVASGGRISQVGVLSGFATPVPIMPLMTKEVHIDGIISGSRDSAEAMMSAIDHLKLVPVIDHTFTLPELSNALHHLDAHGAFRQGCSDGLIRS
jgi:NADPH:quinone reductase-like Zn-dependent oxidoreductase